MKPLLRSFSVVLLTLFFAATAPAQWTHTDQAPYLDYKTYRYLAGEISGDSAYEFDRYFTQFHRPRGGAEGLMRVAEYVAEQAKKFNLQDVRLIRQRANNSPWTARRGEVWMIEPELQLIASISQTPIHLSDNSRSADLETALVDVGSGAEDKDYENKNVGGKVALAYGNIPAVMEQAVWKRNAAGILYHPNPTAIDYPLNSVSHPDQVKWTGIPWQSPDGKPSTFAFSLSHRQGMSLRNRLAAGPVKVKVKIEADTAGEPWQVMVEAFIHGTQIQNQDIVLTGHLQEEKFSANDDGSGSANVLEIGRALKRLIDDGKIAPPKRNIRFWWTTEISSERQLFAENPDLPKKLWVNINQDMVGANQSQDVMRVQKITRVPFSRAHFISAMAERLISFLVTANDTELARTQSGMSQPAPIYSHLGTRQRYNAEVIRFHNNTDHMTFTEAPIGVPGITFTNWPDNYIHSSDDDLWNLDRTQLQRNALAVALMAYALANAGSDSVPQFIRDVEADCNVRLARAQGIATDLLATRKIDPSRAENLLRQVELESVLSLESLQAVAEHPAIAQALERVRALSSALRTAWERTAKTPDPLQTEMEGMKPALAGGAELFQAKRSAGFNLGSGLHPLMTFEVINFIDGKRNAWEIYQAVDGEALFGGSLYYGVISPEKVRDLLRGAEKMGIVRME
ncbi:MAG TPA: M28 family peptidase [Acidobacteriota bacterium]